MDWQPIETAPRDGSVILLNGQHQSYPMLGYYDICNDEWSAKDKIWTLGAELVIPDPTHWRERS